MPARSNLRHDNCRFLSIAGAAATRLGQVSPDAAQEMIEETTAQATRDQRLDTASVTLASAFAAFRLITSSNLVGYSMATSPGFAPLSTLSPKNRRVQHGCDDPVIVGEHAPRTPIAAGMIFACSSHCFGQSPRDTLCAAICDVNRQRQYSGAWDTCWMAHYLRAPYVVD